MTGYRKGWIAECFTVGWNVIEGIVAIVAGILAGSIALVGFGLDSYIEVASGLVLIWRLRKHDFRDEDEEEAAERKAILFVGTTFVVLAAMYSMNRARSSISKKGPKKVLLALSWRLFL